MPVGTEDLSELLDLEILETLKLLVTRIHLTVCR
jgi:hypothetical protein